MLALAGLLLLLVLGFAVVRPRGLPEAVAAVPAAAVVVAVGAVTLPAAWAEVSRLLPVVAFLAAVLVVGDLCAAAGLFRWAGDVMAARSRGSGRRLLTLVLVTAAAVTAVLSLDATVVLLTPVVFATAARVGLRPRPHVYACAHLANSASLLLPVSNLTNLLALGVAGLTFAQFAGLMVGPWLAVLVVEAVVLRWRFAGELSLPGIPRPPDEPPVPLPAVPAAVVGLMLIGFVVSGAAGIDAAWVAGTAALILVIRALLRGEITPARVGAAVNVPFLLFVLGLGIVVRAVVDSGLGAAMAHISPAGDTLPGLLGWALVAAVLANVVNNLPAVLLLLPLAAPAGPLAVLAVLIGVDVGPNLTYVGSLATLLWRRIARAHDHDVPLGEFTLLGVLTTPASLLVGVLALWATATLVPGGPL